MAPDPAANVVRWTTQADAFAAFAGFAGKTQSGGQIKPLHWYVACRLVVEGGFDPADIVPRPPFRVERRAGRIAVLHYDAALAGGGERAVLGGLKTKNVDVVVAREGIGPVLAVSCKGVTGAFRNLTNRLEETIGECTNLHITYPALVMGYLVLLRANRQKRDALKVAAEAAEVATTPEATRKALAANDIAMSADGEPMAIVVRFHNALREPVGRRGIRDDVSRYEAIGFGLIETEGAERNGLNHVFPAADSPLNLDGFFGQLYLRHDERFVTGAPDLAGVTRRLQWDAKSPAMGMLHGIDYPVREAD